MKRWNLFSGIRTGFQRRTEFSRKGQRSLEQSAAEDNYSGRCRERENRLPLRAMRSGAVLLAAAAAANAAIISYAAELSGGTQSYRNRVIDVCGISDLEGLSGGVSRADFAKMLVQASSFKDSVGNSQIAAASDVLASDEDAPYVRVALRQGWMRTRLGGNFEPGAELTLNDAVKAVMKLLDYPDEDFSGNVTENRLAAFRGLELDDGVQAKNGTDALTKQEALNILYNLLRTKPKDGNDIYGSVLELSLDSNGEINATDVLELNMTGPILAKNMQELRDALPFALEDANLYFNGQTPGYSQYGIMYYESQLNAEGWIILYYNEDTKTVWAYGTDTGDNTYHCVRGDVEAIYYADDNIITPSSVSIDGTEYSLNNSDVKFMFSINGDIKVGDEVVLICKDNTKTGTDGEEVTDYYAIGVVLYQRNSDGSTTGTAYPQDVTRYSSEKNQSGINSKAGT